MAKTLNISSQIKWLGFVDDEELLKSLEEAHLCFFPSRYEGFGLTLVEAMASKNVCIANDIEAFRNIIGSNKFAYLVDFNDFAESSRLTDSLLSGGFDLLEEIGSEARENAKRFSWSVKIFEIIALYKDILS
jgi:glycosyltransferase involved in cell wall biosynthesis